MSVLQSLKATVAAQIAAYVRDRDQALSMLQRHYQRSRTYKLKITGTVLCAPISDVGLRQQPPPSITVLTPDGLTGRNAQLLVGHRPILARNWSFDAQSRQLSFQQGHGEQHLSGSFNLVDRDIRLTGVLQVGEQFFQVDGELEGVSYDCVVGKDAVAVVGKSPAVTLLWDTTSAQWKNANWTTNQVLRFTYQLVQQGSFGGQTVWYIGVSFEDRTDPSNPVPWVPAGGESGGFTAYATSAMMFDFVASEDEPPPTSSLFPLLFQVQMSPDASSLAGGLLSGQLGPQGTSYGVQGQYNGMLVGVYVVEQDGKPSGVLTAVNGEVRVDDQPVPQMTCTNGHLVWQALPEQQRQALRLPASGELRVSEAGGLASSEDRRVVVRRITPDQALGLARDMDHLPALQAVATGAEDSALSIAELKGFSQFGRPDGKTWIDLVQQESTTNTFDILLYYMDDKLRDQFVSIHKPSLDPTIKTIAEMNGPNGEKASEWYKNLGVAYVAANLGKFSTNTSAGLLNWKRATNWLNQQMQSAGVMQVQGPALYTNQYMKQNDVNKYLLDQQSNLTRYNEALSDEIDAWIAQTLELVVGDQAAKTKVRQDMEVLKSLTLTGRKYWAYVMCRTFISPNFLAFLEALGINPDQAADGTAYARRIQETTALLSILDDSGTFTKKFVDIVEAFDLACIIPKLIDYSGNVDDYELAVTAIFNGFVDKYIDNPAPGMQDAAQALRKVLENDQVRELLDAFAQSMAGVTGSKGFEAGIRVFNTRVLKYVGLGAELVTTGIMMASIGFSICGLVTGTIKWKELDPDEQAHFVEACASTVAMSVTKVVVRGVSVELLLKPDDGICTALKLFLKPLVQENAQQALAQGIKGWLVGGNSLSSEIEGLLMRQLYATSVQETAELASSIRWRTAVGKYLGKNLNEFSATRLGTVLALAGMAFAIYSLVEAKNPFETAANACFLAAATADFFIAAGMWAIAEGVVSIGGVAIAPFLPFLSVFAILAFIAGAVLLILMLFVCKPKDPLQVFAEKDAKKAGFYIPYRFAIESFEVYQPAGEIENLGLAFQFNQESAQCLTVANDGTLSIGPLDNTPQTVFFLQVDYQGRASIAAPLVDADGTVHTRVLAVDKETGTLVAPVATASSPIDPYAQWICDAMGSPVRNGGELQAGTFTLYNAGLFDKHQTTSFLTVANGVPTVGTSSAVWELVMSPTKVLGVRMGDISLYTFNEAQQFQANITNVSSAPLSWSLQPSLPNFMAFDASLGKVYQIPSTKPSVTAPQEHNITVSNALGSASTTFTFQVQAL